MAIFINGKKVAGIGPPGADGKSAYQSAVDGGYTGTESEFNALLANAGAKPKSISITLSASAWVNSLVNIEDDPTGTESTDRQTVTAPGVLADETKQLIQPMPAIASQDAYISAGIICSGQAADSLTFTCSKTPTEDITLYVVITEVGA